MYFWKLDKLNEQLISGPLDESESFKYLMANSIVYALAAIQYDTANVYDTWGGLGAVIITIIGLILIYKINGGKDGANIMQRYLSIGFVVFIRFFILFLLPAVITFLIIQEIYFGGIAEETTLSFFILMIISEVVLILWVAKNIQYVAKHNNA